VEKAHVAAESVGSGTGEWPLRERLLAFILEPIKAAKEEGLSWDELKRMLWSDSGLRSELSHNLTNPLISQKRILNALPEDYQEPVRQFLSEFLTTGGNMPC